MKDLVYLEEYKRYVSRDGRVFRCKGNEIIECKSTIGSNGYKKISVTIDGKHHTINVHRLVALAFLPRIEGCDIVDHIDRDKLNNDVSNLRWCTQKDNMCNKKGNVEGMESWLEEHKNDSRDNKWKSGWMRERRKLKKIA